MKAFKPNDVYVRGYDSYKPFSSDVYKPIDHECIEHLFNSQYHFDCNILNIKRDHSDNLSEFYNMVYFTYEDKEANFALDKIFRFMDAGKIYDLDSEDINKIIIPIFHIIADFYIHRTKGITHVDPDDIPYLLEVFFRKSYTISNFLGRFYMYMSINTSQLTKYDGCNYEELDKFLYSNP